MSGFLDIHAHIMPGVDDGPATFEETLEMLRIAHAAGTRALVATPHMFMPLFEPRSASAIRALFVQLIETLEVRSREDPEALFLEDLELFLGAENFCSVGFLNALDEGEVLSLNDGRYLLLEFGPHFAFGLIEEAARRVLQAGYVPLMAHVERYPVFQDDSGRLAALVEAGCLAQVNGGSLLASPLSRRRRKALRFLKSDLIWVVASDGHNAHRQSPRLNQAQKVLTRTFGEARARAWTETNPRQLVGASAVRSPS